MAFSIAFITYETPYAPCGGIAAVMALLPGCIKAASGLDTVVITPFHHNIQATASLQKSTIGQVSVPFNGGAVPVRICEYEDSRFSWKWYFLEADDPALFSGEPHPFRLSSQDLLRDALFFGAAVSRALEKIAPQASWKLLMQDWEGATAALDLASQAGRCELFLTLHNTYDSPASDNDLRRAGIDPRSCPGNTVLQRALPIVQRPVFTVSGQFAMDLTGDILQTQVMADHLQGLLSSGLIGIDNGPLASLAVPKDVLAQARTGDCAPLQGWKAEMRNRAIEALGRHKPSGNEPVWGDIARFKSISEHDRDIPWFVMAGRDDPRQKGYDVAVCAVRGFLEQGGNAQFLFFPIPGDEGRAGLEFLREAAAQFPGRVLVLPFVWKEGFHGALRGATYGLMPSFYEPFGMANEFYMNGTVGIGRATGGILQQIVPLRAASSFSGAVQIRSARWHAASAQPTGILHREIDGIQSEAGDWRAINACDHAIGGKPDRIHARQAYPLFQQMAFELRLAIEDGVRLFRNSRPLYYRMLVGGIAHTERNFSWQRGACEYLRHMSA